MRTMSSNESISRYLRTVRDNVTLHAPSLPGEKVVQIAPMSWMTQPASRTCPSRTVLGRIWWAMARASTISAAETVTSSGPPGSGSNRCSTSARCRTTSTRSRRSVEDASTAAMPSSVSEMAVELETPTLRPMPPTKRGANPLRDTSASMPSLSSTRSTRPKVGHAASRQKSSHTVSSERRSPRCKSLTIRPPYDSRRTRNEVTRARGPSRLTRCCPFGEGATLRRVRTRSQTHSTADASAANGGRGLRRTGTSSVGAVKPPPCVRRACSSAANDPRHFAAQARSHAVFSHGRRCPEAAPDDLGSMARPEHSPWRLRCGCFEVKVRRSAAKSQARVGLTELHRRVIALGRKQRATGLATAPAARGCCTWGVTCHTEPQQRG